jgi:hypothetical protein
VVRDREILVSTGSRRPGSPSAERAAKWLSDQLGQLGASVEVWTLTAAVSAAGVPPKPAPTRAIVGVLAGESESPLLLLARYDTLPDERDGAGPANLAAAAGAAMVLELGRVLAGNSRPYPIWLIFVEGDGLGRTRRGEGGARGDEALLFPGSDAVALELARRMLIERVRLAIFFGSLPGPQLVVERDLRSHRLYRESFWQGAEALGEVGLFPPASEFDSPQQGHLAFLARGLRPTVALVGAGADESAGAPPGDTGQAGPASAADLEHLGRVTLDTMERITSRLRRIDAFAKSPLGEAASEAAAAPSPGPNSPGPGGPDSAAPDASDAP